MDITITSDKVLIFSHILREKRSNILMNFYTKYKDHEKSLELAQKDPEFILCGKLLKDILYMNQQQANEEQERDK